MDAGGWVEVEVVVVVGPTVHRPVVPVGVDPLVGQDLDVLPAGAAVQLVATCLLQCSLCYLLHSPPERRRRPGFGSCAESSCLCFHVWADESGALREETVVYTQGFHLFFDEAASPVAVHHGHFQKSVGGQLFLQDVVLGGEHLADLHEGFVFGLGDNEEGVDGHPQADHAEDQVAVRTHGVLRRKGKTKPMVKLDIQLRHPATV
ncbi:hypothetical protein EYF80_018574 [Liparis tanakae]|uniref:Uncharacterized protein n=1 Tax=Liparis tanakae TaxID=230148 RepID=A0A4Z2HZL4_9TELE|nr:hypothetical protein EYF80_018574 [Liparis tanakae]